MKLTREIDEVDCKKIAQIIRDDIFTTINTYKISIFLCGADINAKDKIRYQIAEEFKSLYNSYFFDIIYPEDIFDELLYSSRSKDLLSLENLLAESVDVILIVPESPGSFAELGAFSNNENLRSKIICLVDEKYKKDKSFINKGPIKLIRDTHRAGVIFMNTNNISHEMEKITAYARQVKKRNVRPKNKINLLQLDRFLLPTIYLLEPVNDKILGQIVGEATGDAGNAFEASRTALSLLTKKKTIEYTTNGYKLTKHGLEKFESLRRTSSRIKIQAETTQIDLLRLKILNYKLRNKSMRL